MKFELDRDERKRLIRAVQKFFSEQRDEDIGVIAADGVVDFFIDTLGAALYNAALDSARAWFAQALGNLEVDYDQLYRR
jgi:uncharacterized protein (DUF2164 family)